MSLMVPLLALFIFLGLTQPSITPKIYLRTVGVILLIALIFYFRQPF